MDEALGDYIKFSYRWGGEFANFINNENLWKGKLLAEDKFLRIHKSYIVNLAESGEV